MPIQAVSNRDNFSDTLTMGLGGASIGVGVGYLLKPSLDMFTKTAQQVAVQNTSNDIHILTSAIKEAKTNGFKNISKGIVNSLSGIGEFRNTKEMQAALGDLVQEKILFQGGKIYEKALNRLSKNKKQSSSLVANAQNVLKSKIATAQKFMTVFNDEMVSLFKSSAPTKGKEVVTDIMHQAKYNNAVKGGIIGAALAVTLFSLGLMLKPKKQYIIIPEQEKTV